MKRLSRQEFGARTEAIARARRIFIPHFTKNVTVAFELYEEVLAEQERDRFLTTVSGGRAPMTWLDQYERPICPECGEPLYLRLIREPEGPRNKKGWKTCWECLGPTCCYEQYSKKDLTKWLKRLRRKKDA